MAEFVLFSTIIFLVFSIAWSKETPLNLFVKVVFTLMTVYGAYVLFGPANVIAQLAK